MQTVYCETEDIERRALAALHAGASDGLRQQLGLTFAEIDGAFVSIAAKLAPTAIALNRVIGLGVGGQPTRETVEQIMARYREAGVENYYVHLHPDAQPAELSGWLESAGLQRTRPWMKFVRGREAPPKAESDLTVRRVKEADALAFSHIVAEVYLLGPESAEDLARLFQAEGWHLYMTFDGDRPAGTGALYVHDETGFCDWAATAPAFRGRGSQTALLARRIADAIDLGCQRIFTETSDPGHAFSNITRMGFVEDFVRENYTPAR